MHPIILLATLVGAVALLAIFVIGAKAVYQYGLKVKKYYDDNENQVENDTKKDV